ncbi:hypothetical protein DFO66_103191 [Brevibacterium sanguinis]|uniref:LPXTG-motif cell wall-anchored protein n=2 Tax=Brevibacterium TaxID=1696 RepID=A0A366IKZ9_9MICO|nr:MULTISPECIES: S1 family peptidase [Brevibacterium]RBP66247.1 hypothetical protein DFO66_103191 [Brevibacterium sanguinis]RBP72898.1 hypothetical protein DFO65_103190 [Brevibacterium celere]
MQKKFVQSSLALTAAAALGLGGAFVAGPAAATPSASPSASAAAQVPQKLDVQNEKKAAAVAADIEGVNAFGVSNGKLYVGVEAETKEVKELQEKYSNVVVTLGVQELEPHAKTDAVGGAGYLMSVPGGSGVCSTGFSGWDGAGNPVVLTAGHCSEVLDETTNETVGASTIVDTERPSTAEANGGEGFEPQGVGPLGEWGFTKFGSDVLAGDDTDPEPKASDIDFAVIKMNDAVYDAKNGVTDWTTADSDDLSASTKPISKVGAHTEGSVSKSGRTTGVTEGQVIPAEQVGFEWMNVGGRWVHGFAVESSIADPFSQPGDSGGAVYQGDTAVGVISGGGPAEWNDGTEFQLGWVADLDYSLEQSGVEFSLTDPNAEPEAPAAPVVKDQTIKPNGAVTGKAAAGVDVKITWKPKAGAQGATEGEETVKANAEGNFTIEGPEAPGQYDYTATASNAGGSSDTVPFVVTVEEPPAEADAATDGADAGAAAEGAEADANAEGAEADASADGADAGAEADAGADAAEADASAGADDSKDGGEETPAERAISIEPKEIVDTDFVNKDKGVTITVEGFDEGENVTLEVVAGPNNVQGIELNETANKDGVAAFNIYGVNDSDPSVYRGKYDVNVTGANDTADEKALTGSFEVVAAEDGKGGGDGGSDLPRTGAELTGLAAGAALLVVGGAAVVLTMRRNSKKN